MEIIKYEKQNIIKKIKNLKSVIEHEFKSIEKYNTKLKKMKQQTPKQQNNYLLCLLTIEEKSEYYNKLNNDLIFLKNTLKLISK